MNQINGFWLQISNCVLIRVHVCVYNMDLTALGTYYCSCSTIVEAYQ